MGDNGWMSCTMTFFQFRFISVICVIQVPVTWSMETQMLGYEETGNLQLNADVTSNRTIITDPTWPFPSDGHVVAFNVRVHGDGLGSNITLQIWRPMGHAGGYSLVAASRDTDSSTTGNQRITLGVPQRIQRGDVIGLYSEGQNPVPYHLPGGKACNETGYLYLDGNAGSLSGSNVTPEGGDVTRTFRQGRECRWYFLTAEYELDDVDLMMSILGDDVTLRSESDVAENGVIMPHFQSGFPTDGMLYGWKAFLQGPGQAVVFQVWRLVNESRYTKVHESPPYTQPIPGAVHFRLRPEERVQVLHGDVIALGYPLGNPIRFDYSKTCEHPYMWGGGYGGRNVSELKFTAGIGGKACRRYSFQAEYYYPMPELPTANTTTAVNITTPSPTTSTSTTTTPPPTSTTTTSTTTSTARHTGAPSTPPAQAYFGWDVPSANNPGEDHPRTIIPDVGHGFPQDGKVIGWVFNVSRMGNRVGLQVWRPMPEYPTLTPHARDFAYVGGTKPVLPWHRGENRFSLDQVGEVPFPVRRGDVIGLRVEESSPIPYYKAGTECTGRYYMDDHGAFSPCDRFIMEQTVVCRLYPIKAMVIWDDEIGKKAQECPNEMSNLVPSAPPTPERRTHIDGCLILSIKSADATYQLTNPDYPNITKLRDLCWVIHLDPKLYSDLYIQIKINDLDLRVPKKCDTYTSDFLEVRDGEWSTSKLLRRYCVGWAASGEVVTRTDVITACNHFLYIRLRTSRTSYGFKGFKLHYQAIKRSSDGTMCIRTLPIAAPNAARSRNAAIITVVVVVGFIGLVCLIAYIRKVGFKVPQWFSGYFFRHRQFHNQDMGVFGAGNDSPRHATHSSVHNSELQPAGVNGTGQSSGYVTFVPGGYPTNGEPVLQLGKMAATRPVTTATDSSVMEGITDIGEPIPDSWSPAANGRTDQYGGERIPVDSPLGGVHNINYCPQNNNSTPGSRQVNGVDSTSSVT